MKKNFKTLRGKKSAQRERSEVTERAKGTNRIGLTNLWNGLKGVIGHHEANRQIRHDLEAFGYANQSEYLKDKQQLQWQLLDIQNLDCVIKCAQTLGTS